MSEITPFQPMQSRLTPVELDRLLIWARDEDAADIKLQTGQPVRILRHKRLLPAFERPLDDAEVEAALRHIFGANAVSLIQGGDRGQDLNCRHDVKLPQRNKRARFRANAIQILTGSRTGFQITLRTLPDEIKSLEEQKIPQPIIDNWLHDAGIVIVTGPTGSGKSTLLAGGIKHMVEHEVGHIVTAEDPIEFPLDQLSAPHSFVSQTEIPTHIGTFEAKLAADLRRHPAALMIGEMREPRTIQATILAAQTGHAVYVTGHTIGVSTTIARTVSVFPEEQREQVAFDLVHMLRLVVTQILLPRVGGGLVALREWLVFEPPFRRELLLNIPRKQWPIAIDDRIEALGQSLTTAAETARTAGVIDDTNLHMVLSR